MTQLSPSGPASSLDPAFLSTSVIEAELIASVSAQNASIHTQLKLLQAYDRRGAWVAGGATSCAGWWASIADIELSTARDHMRVARALADFRQLDSCLADGVLSYAKVRYIARYAHDDNVDDLVQLATRIPASRLGYAIAAYNATLMSADEMNARQHANRSVSWKTDADGMYVVSARLLPIDGSHLTVGLDALMMRGTGHAGDLIGQQRYDALMALLAADAKPESATNPAAEIVVHVTANRDGGLVHTLADGSLLPHAQATELMCGATIRALVHDSKARPIDVSPAAPAPTKRQLILIRARDKHCQYRKCTATSFLHAHHIQHREHGGRTTIANLTLVCSFHHRHIHANEPGWKPVWKLTAR